VDIHEQPQENHAESRLRALSRAAARVQDLLADLEMALPADPARAVGVLPHLKQAWREFRDAALREGPRE
jgi:hypothetical protein